MGPSWWGPDWAAWRIFVKTLFGLPLLPDELETFRKCTGLETPPTTQATEAWLPVGRRGGKSRVIAMIAIYLGCCFEWEPYLAPGQQGYISVISDSVSHAVEIMNYVKGALRHMRLVSLVKRGLTKTIELLGSVTIEVVTASIRAVRSRTVIAALCDEIAFWRVEEMSANPDIEILNGLRPAMLTIPGALLLAASSKYARKGELWQNYHDHFGKAGDYLVWMADTKTMHPSVPEAFLNRERERDPVSFEAEYGLSWRTDVAAFIDPAVVKECVVVGRHELPPDHARGVSYVAFTDPSGGSVDSMTLAIAHRERDGKAVIDLLREWRSPFRPEQVVKEASDLLKAYKCLTVKGDHYAGEWPRDRFMAHGITYVTAEMTKSEIYITGLPLLNGRRIELLDDKRCLIQLEQLERRTRRGGGRDVIDHPPRGHDDVINSAIGAVVEATNAASHTFVIPQEMLEAARNMRRR